MSKESQPPVAPPSNEPVVREVKPANRRRPPLFQEFLANFKGGTALEQALAEQAQREQTAETPGDDLLVDQSTSRPVDQSTSRPVDQTTKTKNRIPDRQRAGNLPASLLHQENQIEVRELVDQTTSQLVDQTTSQPASEPVALPNEAGENSPAREHTYPSRVGKAKIGVWLPERQVERMKMWCLLHKIPMQDIIQQAVAEWWEKQPEELALPVESALQTLPAARQSAAKKQVRQ